MASASVNITFSSKFGTRGIGNDNFDFPTGLCVVNDYLYIVDKQNHRIKKHDLTGVFVSEFGTVGSGNNNFYFPEDICTDGTYLYIVDGANNRIKKHDLTGVFVSEYGVRGIGNNEFEYPTAITTDGVYLYVADKGNSRIMKSTINGVYYAKYGTNGSGLNQLNFPEGVTIFDGGKLAICDSANNRVVVLSSNDLSYVQEFGTFDYASRINEINGVLSISDRQANKVYFYDYLGNLITSYSTDLFFPESIFYYNNKIYLCDTASHEIEIFDIDIVQTSSYFLTKIMNLTKQLYPTGRAWYMRKNGIFEKLHEALAYSEANAYQTAIDQLNIVLPDNDSFTALDATRWEDCLGLYNNSMLTLAERKIAILRKINHPGDIKPRQSLSYIQEQLQLAGFNVYLYENKVGVNPTQVVVDPLSFASMDYQLGVSEFGVWEFGGTIAGVNYTEFIANYIDSAKDAANLYIPNTEFGEIEFGLWQFDLNYSYDEGLRQTFFVMGNGFPSVASIDVNRKNEFRELLLKLKPTQMFGYLYVNYI